jgi:hypothetical protein
MSEDKFVKTIGIDFDGVIHQYNGWCDVVNDPIPGAFDAIRELCEGFAVFIHCARNPHPTAGAGGLGAIPAWFKKHGLGIPTYCDEHFSGHFWNRQGLILVTNKKLPAVAYIDDRAIRFENWEQTIADLNFHVNRPSHYRAE